MAHVVFNRKLVLIILVFLTTINLFAQQQTEPAFSFKDSTDRRFSNFHYFIDTYTRVPLDDCLSAYGTFRFKVIKKNGKLSKIYISGNLPDTLVSSVKKRLLETQGHWTFSSKTNSKSSKWFVLPFYIHRFMNSECKNDASTEVNLWQTIKLFDKKTKIIETPTSYLIYPLYLIGTY